MNKWVASFLIVTIVCLTTLIMYNNFKNDQKQKKVDISQIYPAKPQTITKEIIKYRPDPKTELKLQKVQEELNARNSAYKILYTQFQSALAIITYYQNFFKNNNVCAFNYKSQKFDHFGKDKSAMCNFWNNGAWIKKEAKDFGEYVKDRLP